MKLSATLSLSMLGLGWATSLFADDDASMPLTPSYTEEQVLETFGWYLGSRVGAQDLEFTEENKAALLKGFASALAGAEMPVDLELIGPQIDAFLTEKNEAFQAKAALKSAAEAEVFFAGVRATEGVVELPSGLMYLIVEPGEGEKPKATDKVKVHYTGSLVDGTVFDSSVQRGQPVEFPLDGVIPGWTEGLQQVQKGGKIKLFIPYDLAYGEEGRPPVIPPRATLVFDVELLDIL